MSTFRLHQIASGKAYVAVGVGEGCSEKLDAMVRKHSWNLLWNYEENGIRLSILQPKELMLQEWIAETLLSRWTEARKENPNYFIPLAYPSENVSSMLHDGYLVTFSLKKDLKNSKMPNL